MTQAPLLQLDGVSAGYGRMDIIHGVSLSVQSGEVVAIIGPNGAGKSTVLRAVMGLVRVSGGTIAFDGRSITGGRPNDRVAWGLGYVPQGRVVFPRMTVMENLDMGAFTVRSAAAKADALDFVLTLFPRLAERRSQMAGKIGRAHV